MRIDEVIQQPGQKERALKNDILRSLHVAVPGEIVTYDPTKRTAVIQPTIREWNSTENPPLLTDVPVFFAGNYTFTPQKGDGCLVVFADSCIDAWLQNGGVSTPVTARSHSMSDGFAFVGFNQTGGTPIGSGGFVVKTYTVENVSGSYSHTFTDTDIVADMKPVQIEYGNISAFADDVEVTPGSGTLKIECNDVTGTSTVTITLLK